MYKNVRNGKTCSKSCLRTILSPAFETRHHYR